MHESQILDVVDSLTLGQLSLNEKAIIVADIKSEISNTRLASNITSLVLEKVNDLSKGLYKESQALPKTFQDFSESEGKQKPFEITNQDEIESYQQGKAHDRGNPDTKRDVHCYAPASRIPRSSLLRSLTSSRNRAANSNCSSAAAACIWAVRSSMSCESS